MIWQIGLVVLEVIWCCTRLIFFFCLVCKHENILGLEFVLTLVLEIIGWFARMFSFFFVLSFFSISIVCKDDGVLATFLKLA